MREGFVGVNCDRAVLNEPPHACQRSRSDVPRGSVARELTPACTQTAVQQKRDRRCKIGILDFSQTINIESGPAKCRRTSRIRKLRWF